MMGEYNPELRAWESTRIVAGRGHAEIREPPGKWAGSSQPSATLFTARHSTTVSGLEGLPSCIPAWVSPQLLETGLSLPVCDLLAGELLNLFPHFYKGHDNNHRIVQIK